MRNVRVFISSPGDTQVERRRAERVVSRLNGEFAGLARLEAIRWETAFYRADATFQAQIPPAVDCDVVVGILRWRLGTELPPGFVPQPDGASYPSGTAYELLTAIDRRRSGAALPDVFVFRYAGSAPSIVIGEADEAAKRRDWAALQAFFARWFVSEAGHFTAALNTYASEDEFERQAETLLRKWVVEKIAAGRVVPWPAAKGSPFRGLDAFGARHAPVFFGRDADIRQATDLWRDAAARGTPFLLLLGASGAGKSSLLRAGLVPRLTTPGVVPEVDLWRTAVLRPGDSPDGPFAALAAALLRDSADLPPDEEGRGAALPDIAEGDAKTPADLAALLAHGDETAVRCLHNALARIGERARTAERFGRAVRCDLVLVIDQAEELFAPSVSAAVRTTFAGLLGRMAASGRIWIAATLRADLYAAFIETPALKALKDAGAAFDLAPPGPAELAEIVRAPAEAAGLVFDVDPATGERLDALLLREADRPDMLPLVQLALSRLWEARATRGDETVLPLAAYRAIGGLEGMIAEAGAAALADSDPAVLPALIRRLAELAPAPGQARSGATLTTRAVPLAEAAPDPAARALVDALVRARLLSLSDQTGASVRLAHQRVLRDWPAAAAIVADSADFYRVRDEVEAARRRWEAGRRRGDLLLPRGLPLAEARAMTTRYARELAPATLAYIAASRRRANRAQLFAWSAAAVFALVAIGAVAEGRMAAGARAEAEDRREEAELQRAAAVSQRQAAQLSLAAAKTALDGLVYDIADGLRGTGVPVATMRRILETARATLDRLADASPGDHDLAVRRNVILANVAITYRDAGDLSDAAASAGQAVAGMRVLVARAPADDDLAHDLAVDLDLEGDLKLRSGDARGAIAVFGESLAIARGLVARHPGNPYSEQVLEAALEGLGDAKLRTGDTPGALAALDEDLAFVRNIVARAPGNAAAERELALRYERIGRIQAGSGDAERARVAFGRSVDLRHEILARDPDNAQDRRNLAMSLAGLGEAALRGGDAGAALKAFSNGIEILRKLAAGDPGSIGAERDLSAALKRSGEVALGAGDAAAALAAFGERAEVLRVVAGQRPGDPQARTDLAAALGSAAHAALLDRDFARALSLSDQAIGLRPDLVFLYGDRAHALMLLGRDDEALDLYLRYRGTTTPGHLAWERSIADDFDTLRRAGISDPLMNKVEQIFGTPPPANGERRD